MSLTSELTLPRVTYRDPSQFTFPGVFRSKDSGALWLARSSHVALRILAHSGPISKESLARGANHSGYVGEHILATVSHEEGISPKDYEQVTQPVTLTFNP